MEHFTGCSIGWLCRMIIVVRYYRTCIVTLTNNETLQCFVSINVLHTPVYVMHIKHQWKANKYQWRKRVPFFTSCWYTSCIPVVFDQDGLCSTTPRCCHSILGPLMCCLWPCTISRYSLNRNQTGYDLRLHKHGTFLPLWSKLRYYTRGATFAQIIGETREGNWKKWNRNVKSTKYTILTCDSPTRAPRVTCLGAKRMIS